ncbi:PRELI domain-containing protein 1, mitochondrial-like [Mobula birostris]|uniref:PRELI domain-containing protein 1, mitochondrial-like n=1 Tax=Mobula birostris TaxID=1983395 RepID=UPI003B27B6AA
MVKYYLCLNDLKNSWDQVFAAFWQRYPNPYSKHVLTEDVIHREITPERVISRRLLTKTSVVPRWAKRLFPTNVAHSAFVLEDSVVDLKHKTLTTFTRNINHSRLMVVQEFCVYGLHPENMNWTQIKREAWISSSLYGFSLAIQECGLASFKNSITKTMKGFEYVLARMHGETPMKTLRETAKEATEKAKETALAASEKAKDLASKAGPQKKKQYV